MANILGQLLVELKANTADFISGMGGASRAARNAGREIESSFSSLSQIASSALGSFGPLGSTIAATLGQIGKQAGQAVSSFGKLRGSMDLVAAGSAGVTAAAGTVGVASLGLAAGMASSAARMYELSEKTGVSIETLSAFGYAAKQSGVDTETMTTGLERLSRSMFAAATAPTTAVNAFTRLGISVRDSNGQIRDVGDVMTDVAAKFSTMEDGATKTALAMQLFGRGGAALIPMLNEGAKGITGWTAEAQALGIVLDQQTGQAALKFEQQMRTVQAAGEGIALQVMSELLPALQTFANFLVAGLKDKSSGLHTLIEGFVQLAKQTLVTGDAVWSLFKQIGATISALGGSILAVLNYLGSVAIAAGKLAMGDWAGARAEVRAGYAGLTQEGQKFLDDTKKIWGDYAKFAAGMDAKLPAATKTKTKPPGADVTAAAAKPDQHLAAINKTIDALRAQTAAELELAGATGQSVAAENLQKAASEADQIITRLMGEADRSTGAERAKLIAVIKTEASEIRALTAEKQVAKDAVAIDAELNKESLAYDRQIASLHSMAAAYAAGGAAIASAEIDARLEGDRQKVEQLQEEYSRLAAVQGVSTDALARISAALAVANADLEEHRRQLLEEERTQYDVEINKQSDALRGMPPLLENLNAAYLTNSEAVREAEVAIEVYNWQLAHPGARDDQMAKIGAQFEKQSLQAREAQDAQTAAQFSIGKLWDDQITRLDRAREVMQTYGADTLLIDAQIYDEENRLIQQWDQAAFAVGTFGEKFTAVMNELVVQGREAGAEVMRSIVGALDSVETALAKVATGQKANFQGIFKGLAESVTKSEIQKGVGSIAKSLGFGNIPGLTPKADGSEANPFYVHLSSVEAGLLGPGGGGVGGLLGGLLGGGGGGGGLPQGAISDWTAGGATGSGILGTLARGIGGLFGGGGGGGIFGAIAKGIGGLFGGGRAAGGDLTPGKWYVAGEKGPEVIVPKAAGSVAPLDRIGGKTSQTTNVVNINGVKDFDLFRRSESQLMAQFHRQASIAYGRS